MSPLRVPLKFGLVAQVVTDDSDRPPYVPPPIAPGEHAESCGCVQCVMARQSAKKRRRDG